MFIYLFFKWYPSAHKLCAQMYSCHEAAWDTDMPAASTQLRSHEKQPWGHKKAIRGEWRGLQEERKEEDPWKQLGRKAPSQPIRNVIPATSYQWISQLVRVYFLAVAWPGWPAGQVEGSSKALTEDSGGPDPHSACQRPIMISSPPYCGRGGDGNLEGLQMRGQAQGYSWARN